jgi:EpsI family protein
MTEPRPQSTAAPAPAEGRAESLLLAAFLLAVALAAWWLMLRPELVADTARLDTVPVQVAGLLGSDVSISGDAESMLRADHHFSRAYRHPLGDVVWAYVGYYGTSRGGRPEHLPATCYRAHGWDISGRRTVDLEAAGTRRATEMVVRRPGEERLVFFWFRSHRRTGMVNGLELTWDHLVGRVAHDRADGALVRVSTPVRGGDLVTARSRLAGFGAAFDSALDARWPAESPVAAGG